MKKEFEKEQKDNQIDDAFLDMPDMDDDEKFNRWLEDEYLKEADAIEESLFAGRKFEDNQDIAEKLSVSRESFYQRMREEGMLDEETEESAADSSEEENSNGTVEMPAGEELEKKVLEFRKNPETAQEDIGSAEKVVSIEKKSSAKKKHSYVRLGRIAGIAGVCLICVFAASMSSEANRKYLVNSVRILSGNDSQFLVDSTEDNEQASTKERDAIADIEETLGIKIPEFYYRPYGMEFVEYEVRENSSYADIEYQYKDSIEAFYIDKEDQATISKIKSLNGTEKVLDEVINGDVKIVIKELKDENDQQTTYIATWAIGECTYSWIGKMQVDELKKIVKEMKF